VGRPPLWGLAANGEAGAAAALKLMADEVERTMVLLGATNLAELHPHHVLAGGRNV
jgi:(S)-mandelate dehydrogenase